ncbi:MAG: polyphosphate kinase [Rhodobacteraceae bacterium]|nr:polyphosphate kinase [Paracoccaceae bacterium]
MDLDHIVVAGATLQEATAMAEDALGVSLVAGGKHAAFGTHNRLLGLDDGFYVEAIAIDPEAPPPDRPRWFDLDAFAGPARPTNWVCRTRNLAELLQHLPGIGTPMALARGDLRWQMAVPDTGRLPFDNLCPALIEWQGDLHPSQMLAPSGCRLKRLVISHPEAADLSSLLAHWLTDARLAFVSGPAGLSAEIDTPHGLRTLG